MAKANPFVSMFQTALGARETGAWNEQTRTAMQNYQAENGLDLTSFPNAETLALLREAPGCMDNLLEYLDPATLDPALDL